MLLTWQLPKAPTTQQYSCWTLTFNLNTGLNFSTKQPPSSRICVLQIRSSLCCGERHMLALPLLTLNYRWLEWSYFCSQGSHKSLHQVVLHEKTHLKPMNDDLSNDAVQSCMTSAKYSEGTESQLTCFPHDFGWWQLSMSVWVSTLVERHTNTQITFLECDFIIE